MNNCGLFRWSQRNCYILYTFIYYILIFGFVLFETPVEPLTKILEIRTWNKLSAAQNLIETSFMVRLWNGTEAAWMGKKKHNLRIQWYNSSDDSKIASGFVPLSCSWPEWLSIVTLSLLWYQNMSEHTSKALQWLLLLAKFVLPQIMAKGHQDELTQAF